MSLPHAEAPGLQPPEVAGDRVVTNHWQRRVVRSMLEVVAEEGFISPSDIPEVGEHGTTILTPVLAAYTALALGAHAEEAADEQRRNFINTRALLFGEAALQAGAAQDPPLEQTEATLYLELEDMVVDLRDERGGDLAPNIRG